MIKTLKQSPLTWDLIIPYAFLLFHVICITYQKRSSNKGHIITYAI